MCSSSCRSSAVRSLGTAERQAVRERPSHPEQVQVRGHRGCQRERDLGPRDSTGRDHWREKVASGQTRPEGDAQRGPATSRPAGRPPALLGRAVRASNPVMERGPGHLRGGTPPEWLCALPGGSGMHPKLNGGLSSPLSSLLHSVNRVLERALFLRTSELTALTVLTTKHSAFLRDSTSSSIKTGAQDGNPARRPFDCAGGRHTGSARTALASGTPGLQSPTHPSGRLHT